MFRKIVSNLPFSPTLVGQLGFYATRLRKEETTRRVGLIFTALALVVQSFAVFTPPESANAANGSNIIYGGFKDKNDLLGIYDRNLDSARHTDIQQIYTLFGVTRQDLANASMGSFNSRDFNLSIDSVGRSTYSWQRTAHAVPGTSSVVYSGKLYNFDSTSWTKSHGSTYQALIGKRASDGQWFAIMQGCGNPAFITLPPPPPQPVASCLGLSLTPISRTRFTFTAKASVANGATISGYTYTIKDTKNSVIHAQNTTTNQSTNAIDYTFAKDGTYTVDVVVATSTGKQTGPACAKSISVSPEPRCKINPDFTESSPECKPCESDNTIWYKDDNCTSNFTLTKTLKNSSQLITDANNTTVHAGDRLEYTLTVKNVGKTTGTYTIQDNLADVLEYADLIDAGGGVIAARSAATPVEKVGVISWPAIEIKPGASIQKIVSVQVKSVIPAIAQSTSNPESYNCRMVNDFAGNHTVALVQCPTPKAVEQVVTQLPRTGTTENMLFAGLLISVVTYFYARSRQVKKEVRLIRRDINAGTI